MKKIILEIKEGETYVVTKENGILKATIAGFIKNGEEFNCLGHPEIVCSKIK